MKLIAVVGVGAASPAVATILSVSGWSWVKAVVRQDDVPVCSASKFEVVSHIARPEGTRIIVTAAVRSNNSIACGVQVSVAVKDGLASRSPSSSSGWRASSTYPQARLKASRSIFRPTCQRKRLADSTSSRSTRGSGVRNESTRWEEAGPRLRGQARDSDSECVRGRRRIGRARKPGSENSRDQHEQLELIVVRAVLGH